MSIANRDKHKPNHKCLNCGKEYYRFPYEIRGGVKLCCSIKCRCEHSRLKCIEHHKPNTVCANCGDKFYRLQSKKKSKSGLYFCSRVCQNEAYKKHAIVIGPESKYLTRQEQQTLSKDQCDSIRRKRTRQKLKRKCAMCDNTIYDINKSGYCHKCFTKYKYLIATPEQRQKWSEDAKRRMAEGKSKPWQSRNTLSYPERFFKKVLENNGIRFEGPNYPIKQKDLGIVDCLPCNCYFLDFKIGNIDLEIDGKQHTYKEFIEKDIRRDKILTDNGWKVYRIKWNEINTTKGKQLMQEKINAFLIWYKNQV